MNKIFKVQKWIEFSGIYEIPNDCERIAIQITYKTNFDFSTRGLQIYLVYKQILIYLLKTWWSVMNPHANSRRQNSSGGPAPEMLKTSGKIS